MKMSPNWSISEAYRWEEILDSELLLLKGEEKAPEEMKFKKSMFYFILSSINEQRILDEHGSQWECVTQRSA